MLKVTYDSEVDSLYLARTGDENKNVESEELLDNEIVLEYDEEGTVIGISVANCEGLDLNFRKK